MISGDYIEVPLTNELTFGEGPSTTAESPGCPGETDAPGSPSRGQVGLVPL